MKKILIWLLVVSSWWLVLNKPVFSQAMSEQWSCLFVQRCGTVPACMNAPIQATGGRAHVGYLTLPSGVTLPPNSDTYIVECIAGPEGQVCTTGRSNTDMIVYKKDNKALLAPLKYSFNWLKTLDGKEVSNPIKSDANGLIPAMAWRSNTAQGLKRQFLALNYIPPTPTSGPTTAVATGSVGALQQGTFGFSFNTALSAGNDQSCVTVSWDPYGRVFDSQTLEPVMNSSVTLFLKKEDGSFLQMTPNDLVGGNIINPQIVVEDGMFNFVVPDGTYKLSVLTSGYIFPVADLSKIHSNYSKIYSDIYPAQTGEEIVQVGEIQHRDIPIETNGSSISTPPKMMEYFYEASPLTKKIMIQGRVSHPMTVINFYSVKPSETEPIVSTRYRQVKQIQVDKMGDFKVEIDQSTFDLTESFGETELIKTDLKILTKKNFYQKIISFIDRFVKKVEAQSLQSTTIKFAPIPTYLEGYAFDGVGNIIPSATVGIYLTYSNKPYYETKADEKGFYKITSENMPKVAYEIRYTSLTGVMIKTTTTDFINQNKQYLSENKVNLNVYKNEKGKIVTSKDKPTIKPTGFFRGSGIGATENKDSQTGAAGKNMTLIIGILTFLIISILVILGIYIMKKKQSGQSNSPTL